MATTLPEPSIPITTPFRPKFGFLAATPIIAVATCMRSRCRCRAGGMCCSGSPRG